MALDLNWQINIVLGYIKKTPNITSYRDINGCWFWVATGNEKGSLNPTMIKCCCQDNTVIPTILEYATPGAAVLMSGKIRHLSIPEISDLSNYFKVENINFISTPNRKGQFDLEAYCRAYGLEKLIGMSTKKKEE